MPTCWSFLRHSHLRVLLLISPCIRPIPRLVAARVALRAIPRGWILVQIGCTFLFVGPLLRWL